MYSWSFPAEKFLPVELLGQGSCVFVKASNACFPSEAVISVLSVQQHRRKFTFSISVNIGK